MATDDAASERRRRDGALYSELVTALREKLAAAGEEGWAEELLRAEQGAATGTEAIARVGIVVRRLHKSGVASRVGLKREAKELERLGQRIWKRI